MADTSESSSTRGSTSYDEAPYPSSPAPQTHPGRLAAIARLFGVQAASPSKARVLELGCGNGANLLPMAERAPGSSFMGIDSSKVQIAAGKSALAAAGIGNVELRVQDILDFPADGGKFDYIIVQGMFSSVSDPVRERILEICSAHLAEDGVAYVSYNALPGWNLRRSLREMMLYHTRAIPAKAKVQQARALMKFLADAVPQANNLYGAVLKRELEFMNGQPDNFIRHDILEEENTAFYFHQFLQRAAKHRLQYLGEPSLSLMLAANFPEKVRATLEKLSGNLIAQEQYMDFVCNRAFRQTLLCRVGVKIRRKISADTVKQFAFQSMLAPVPAKIDLGPGAAVEFKTLGGLKVSVTDPFLKAMFQVLSESSGCAIGYDALLAATRARSRPALGTVPANRDAIDDATLKTNLMNLYTKGMVEIHAEPVEIRMDVPEKPAVSGLMRFQGARSGIVTNRVHRPITLDAMSRIVITLCDGTRTRDELLGGLMELVRKGRMSVKEGEKAITDEGKLRASLAPRLESILTQLAQNGFFAP